MNKRFVIIIAAIFIIVVSLAAVLYFRTSRNAAPPPENEITAEIPPAQIEKLKLLDEGPVISAVPSLDGGAVWYMTARGELQRYDIDSGEKAQFVFPEAVTAPVKVLWQRSGSDIIIEENIDGHSRFRYYDSANEKFVTYPDAVRSPVILAADNKLAYDWVSTPAKAKEPVHELKIADLDTANFKKIADLFRADYVLTASPAKEELVMHAAATSSPLVHVDLATGKFKNLNEASHYTGMKFSPDGTILLAAAANEAGGEIFRLYDLVDSSEAQIDIPASLAQVAWRKDSRGLLYVTEQGLYEMDLRTGETAELYVFAGSETVLAAELILDTQKDALFIVDETGALYYLDYSSF